MGTARPGSDHSSAGPISEPGGEHKQRQGRARQCPAFHLPSRCLELGSPAQPSEIVFLHPARSSSLAPYQAGLVMQCVPLSPHVLFLSFRLFWVFLSLCWYRNRQGDFFLCSCGCRARSICLLGRTTGVRAVCAMGGSVAGGFCSVASSTASAFRGGFLRPSILPHGARWVTGWDAAGGWMWMVQVADSLCFAFC